MTREEASRRYMIPAEILDEYERWGLCASVKQVMGCWQYDERDLERLSLIMALHDIGFSAAEVEAYMRLALAGDDTSAQRLKMLEQLRSQTLDEIHLRERQLDRLDYLRHRLNQGMPFLQEDAK